MTEPHAGYTLPVFACAAAVAALRWVRQNISSLPTVSINLLEPAKIVDILIEQVALLKNNTALAITRSDPGNNLDLTRNTPVWAMIELAKVSPTEASEQIVIIGGAGIGHNIHSGEAAIYSYARRLLQENLPPLLNQNEQIKVSIILPEGRQLATRTSNSAFGIVEGLSLLGTTGVSQPLSVPGQLDAYRDELQQKAAQFNCLVFCVGENGLDLARKMGIPPQQTIKTANWLGPMLVAAAIAGLESILLLGYHGKLIKLAGGIFHTHHHLADGRLEILTAHCANIGLPTPVLQKIFACTTAEAALKILRSLDKDNEKNWVGLVYGAIASRIEERSQAYIFNHSQKQVQVGSMLFDRDRQIFLKTEVADTLFAKICYSIKNVEKRLPL
ncbi:MULTISPECIES: cobalt-precorrin-5B (C(1))-methyltransferase CbiD [Okeania]|uniref:Cobalt-precorrin-5B C(1)-methyltransferase n=1 Tax=Okeania hirsuta TaxID=1458930 RepID=A0A3N6QI28_9CYAN|nr:MULTISPECIES: cobalt-precorrin-5B (C(1))-methyltransferase CbiD [Okeania]NEP74820.1 cobalt-precorrin-5B (C(1))-methyltransferase [Okeania sp. SIO2G5]NEP94290.1 cobalt-precorrin-5B (C(1))-methyltransferase [Okeania sp. SIO2F5]NEQ93637.1 cobalt-precorrin-5B (C(1))-methyltransferase [Okeania sp. SIO2G4]NES79092.1 cobalt-precorrin-5B (C(1))-methyltransferase [Okeania sp. SIO1H4]NES90415.1 cobalt-precorrin-5B (C(1))-methyltransferase [Okeania sp. SIO2B9]